MQTQHAKAAIKRNICFPIKQDNHITALLEPWSTKSRAKFKAKLKHPSSKHVWLLFHQPPAQVTRRAAGTRLNF
jgi:hypothetical protein